MLIGGNCVATLQKLETSKNEYGERVQTYTDYKQIRGFLDMQNGNTKYDYNAKLVDSTHVFVTDYQKIDISVENSRLVVVDNIYRITYIDNPMGLNYHLEIYLEYIG